MGDKLIEEYIAFLEKKRLEELNMFSDVGSSYYDEETDTHVKVETADVGFSKPMYKTKYHVNEVLKRICCTEKNKPVIDLDKLKPGMTKDEIYHLLNYQQRKSLIYIWCTLNDKPHLCIQFDHYDKLRRSLTDLTMRLADMKKLPDYKLMLDCFCVKFGYDYIRPYLYFKENKIHRHLVNEMLT